MTDNAPGGCDDNFDPDVDRPNSEQRAIEAAIAGIHITAVYAAEDCDLDCQCGPGDDGDLLQAGCEIMKNYASKTGGFFLLNGNFVLLEQLLGDRIDDCFDCDDNGINDLCDIDRNALLPDFECPEGSGDGIDCPFGTPNGILDICEDCDFGNPIVETNPQEIARCGGDFTCGSCSGSGDRCGGDGDPACPGGETCENVILGTSDCNGNCWPDRCDTFFNPPTTRPADTCEDAVIICPEDSSGTPLTYVDNMAMNAAMPDGSEFCGVPSSSDDVWFRYVPLASGTVDVDLCGSNFDTVLSVHSGCTTDEKNNPFICSDDGFVCGGSSTVSAVTFTVEHGVEYLIRVGSKPGDCDDPLNPCEINLSIFGPACSLGAPIGGLSRDLIIPAQLCAHQSAPCYPAKNRYLSFKAFSNAGTDTALKVTLDNIPPENLVSGGGTFPDSYLSYVGEYMWVGPPKELCSTPSIGFSGSCLGTTRLVEELQCDPYFTDWSNIGLIEVYGELIIPWANYRIQVAHRACSADLSKPLVESSSLWLPTSRWANVTSGSANQDFCSENGIDDCWGTPAGDVNMSVDAVAMLAAFKGLPFSPIKIRTDFWGTDSNNRSIIDGIVGLNEIITVIEGFKGKPYFYFPAWCSGGSRDGKVCDPNYVEPAVPMFDCPDGGTCIITTPRERCFE